ncbi:MAG: biotin--[acetyl-CoA-carboxylase] ligase [Suipraeoptans sp.]
MKSEILSILKSSETYVSGQTLCEHFGVSRTAIWKAIEQLKKTGYSIEAVRNKGYRLIGQLDILSKEEIESQITTETMGKQVVYYGETDSTNIKAKLLGESGAESGMLVVANRQVSGRGRRGREWISEANTNIYMTILLRPDIEPSIAPMLTLVMAITAAKAIIHVTGLEAKIKWPNDIVVNGKKVCGILTEMSAQTDYINHVVIGVGINANEEDFPRPLNDKATSLKIEGGKPILRSQLIGVIMSEFEKYYNEFIIEKNLSAIKDEYNSLLVNKDSEIMILNSEGGYKAFGLGINDIGELLVKMQDGSIREIYAGEVSVRGIYGYV